MYIKSTARCVDNTLPTGKRESERVGRRQTEKQGLETHQREEEGVFALSIRANNKCEESVLTLDTKCRGECVTTTTTPLDAN